MTSAGQGALIGKQTLWGQQSGVLERGDGRALDSLAELGEAISSVGATGSAELVGDQAAEGVACQAANTEIEAC